MLVHPAALIGGHAVDREQLEKIAGFDDGYLNMPRRDSQWPWTSSRHAAGAPAWRSC